MRIAVIDDLKSDRQLLISRLNKLLSDNSINGEIYEFEKGIDFINASKQTAFEVAFMDIYIDKENGIETSSDYALEGFKVRAFDYLVKPYTTDELKIAFTDILNRLPSSDKYIEVKVIGGTQRIRLNEIIYAEHFKHCINIYKSDCATTVVRSTFAEFGKQLESDERFFMCNRGVIINFDYASDFDGTEFILNNGVRISVSRSLTKSAKSRFADFIFNKR